MACRMILGLMATAAAIAVPDLPLAAQPAPSSDQISVQRCEALKTLDLAGLPDAPAKIVTTSVIRDKAGLPAFCEARGYVSSHVRFAVRMPLAQWNGRMMMQGCGGFCGDVFIERADDALRRNYATSFTDMGHASTALDARWAYNNREAEIDFGYRATHVATVAAKAVVDAFYRSPRKYTYFRGCSTGGRQAMVEAQRYPEDYDGIIAGAPVITYLRGSALQLMSAMNANSDGHGGTWLKPADVRLLERGALDQCDKNDGLTDGIIANPQSCRFDPAKLLCKAGAASPMAGSCLNQNQVDAARKIYAGPHDATGKQVYYGVMPGSEPNWLVNYVGTDTQPPVYYDFIRDLFRYMAFDVDPGPQWQPDMLDITHDLPRLGTMDAIYDGTNPDLRRLKAAGVKIIGYHGWRDQSVVPMTSVDYYQTVVNTMGGLAATRDFYRLYMIPGMNHCFGGPGANSFDFLSAMEAWVERGEAPDRIVGQSLQDGKVVRTRPAYPWPDAARYLGKGNPDDAASFGKLGAR